MIKYKEVDQLMLEEAEVSEVLARDMEAYKEIEEDKECLKDVKELEDHCLQVNTRKENGEETTEKEKYLWGLGDVIKSFPYVCDGSLHHVNNS